LAATTTCTREALGVQHPQAAVVAQRVRRAARHAQPLDARGDGVEVFGEAGEAQVLQLLHATGLVERTPGVRVARRVQVEPPALSPGHQAEAVVEARGLLEVGHGEDEGVERMHAVQRCAIGVLVGAKLDLCHVVVLQWAVHVGSNNIFFDR
jgi:hypothetical protein